MWNQICKNLNFNFDPLLPGFLGQYLDLNVPVNMNNVKVEDKLDGDSKFKSWKSMILIILEENDLLKFVNEKVP